MAQSSTIEFTLGERRVKVEQFAFNNSTNGYHVYVDDVEDPKKDFLVLPDMDDVAIQATAESLVLDRDDHNVDLKDPVVEGTDVVVSE